MRAVVGVWTMAQDACCRGVYAVMTMGCPDGLSGQPHPQEPHSRGVLLVEPPVPEFSDHAQTAQEKSS